MHDIEDASPEQLAEAFLTLIQRLGNLGRDGREAIAAKLKAEGVDDFANEGLAQLEFILEEFGL